MEYPINFTNLVNAAIDDYMEDGDGIAWWEDPFMFDCIDTYLDGMYEAVKHFPVHSWKVIIGDAHCFSVSCVSGNKQVKIFFNLFRDTVDYILREKDVPQNDIQLYVIPELAYKAIAEYLGA